MNNNIRQEIEKIEIPKEVHERSKIGIQKANSEMNKRKSNSVRLVKGIGGMVAATALSISLIAAVNPTFASSIQGYFNDIKNWKGAVIGLEYNDATEKIDIQIDKPILKDNYYVLPITVTFEDAEKHPFSIADALTIGALKIINKNGDKISDNQIQVETIVKEDFTFDIEDSDKLLTEIRINDQSNRAFQGNLIIDKELLSSDEMFILSIDSFFQHAKGEAPLEINGKWKIEFSTK